MRDDRAIRKEREGICMTRRQVRIMHDRHGAHVPVARQITHGRKQPMLMRKIERCGGFIEQEIAWDIRTARGARKLAG